MPGYVILGAGYTGSRVAQALERRGERVVSLRATAGDAIRFDVLDAATYGSVTESLEEGARVLYSLPVLRTQEGYQATAPLVAPLLRRAARVVYLSTTGVYGETHLVDEHTPPAPRHERERLRVDEERILREGAWSTLVLRPAAIYGPGRGVHESMLQRRYRLPGDGRNVISRIHVDDLAAHCLAALDARLTGCFPVADEEPCPAGEMAAFCAELLGVPMPEFTEHLPGDDTRRANRRVDGSAVRRELGIRLLHRGYREGVPASLAAGRESTERLR